MRELTPNLTDWVDDRMFTFWGALREKVPDDSWMPRMSPEVYGVAELGCGVFGCVMPTGRDDTVLKLTTDVSEAMFARLSIYFSEQDKNGGKWDEGVWPEGIVRYKGVYHLKGADIEEGVPVFALWRDAAEDIGFLADDDPEVAGILRNLRQFVRPLREVTLVAMEAGTLTGVVGLMERFLKKGGSKIAEENHDLLFPQMSLTPQRFLRDYDLLTKGAFGIAFYELGIELLSQYAVTESVASAMAYYYDRSIVLADLHPGNIGLMDSTTVITDPGMATILTDEYDHIGIESVEG